MQAEESKWEPVEDYGHIKVAQQFQGKHFNVIDKLLRKTVKNFAQRVYNFEKNTGAYPFLDREKQSISMLLPSFADAADAVYCEQPIPRGKRGQRGYLDYWILYKGNLFLVEVKAAFHAVSKFDDQERDTESPKRQAGLKRLNIKWQRAEKQVDGIEWKEFKLYTGINRKKVKRRFRMILALVVLYKGNKSERDLESYSKDKIEHELRGVSFALSPSPNWSALLSFSNQQVVLRIPGKGPKRNEIYPGVLFLCKVKREKDKSK